MSISPNNDSISNLSIFSSNHQGANSLISESVNAGSSRHSFTRETRKTVSKVHALESDGVASHLFPYLLKMEHNLRRSNQHTGKGSRPVLPISDTIVYKNSFPQAWYGFDIKSNEMIQMPGKKLDASEIYAGFSPVERGCGNICAQFTSVVTDSETGEIATETTYMTPQVLHDWVYDKDNKKRSSSMTTITGGGYHNPLFTTKYVENGFVQSPKKRRKKLDTYWAKQVQNQNCKKKSVGDSSAFSLKEGILQRFVPPRGDNNDTLQVTWSPYLCTMTRRTNIYRLDTRYVTCRERACTFDGPPHLSIETKGNLVIRNKIAESLAFIAQHLLEKEHRVVSRFVGLFKQDGGGNIWLLHMTSIRIQNDNLLEFNDRDPVEISPTYIQPESLCPNDKIDKVLALDVTLDGPSCYEDHREYSRSNVGLLQRPPNPLEKKDTHHVLAKAALKSRDRNGKLPEEYRLFDTFIEDTLYALYSYRMTCRNDTIVALPEVILSARLQSFIGETIAEELMIYCLMMDPVSESSDGSLLFRCTELGSKKLLCTISEECDEILRKVRKGFIIS